MYFSILVGKFHSTGYTFLTPLFFPFLMRVFDNFTWILFEISDAKMLSTFSSYLTFFVAHNHSVDTK